MDEKYKEQIKDVIFEMSEVAGLDRQFAESFFERIIDDALLLEEFLTYITQNRFIGNEKVNGYSIVDVFVWQMDHFKAFLDRNSYAKSNNECEMILMAFDTFMKMKEDPEKYIRMITEESGSDYDGKF